MTAKRSNIVAQGRREAAHPGTGSKTIAYAEGVTQPGNALFDPFGVNVRLLIADPGCAGGPATLGLRTGAAVVPVYLVRDGNQNLKMIIEPELELIRSDKDKTAIRENTLRITQWLERTVRAYPEQWNWMNIHWQEDRHHAAVVKEQRVQGLTS